MNVTVPVRRHVLSMASTVIHRGRPSLASSSPPSPSLAARLQTNALLCRSPCRAAIISNSAAHQSRPMTTTTSGSSASSSSSPIAAGGGGANSKAATEVAVDGEEWYFYDSDRPVRRPSASSSSGSGYGSSGGGGGGRPMHSSAAAELEVDDDGYNDSTANDKNPSPAARALRQRRRLFAAAVALKATVDDEIAAEVRRDAEDGAAAVPPFAPAGWTVRHPPGASYFVMTRTIPGQSRGMPSASSSIGGGGYGGGTEAPRFRSVSEERNPLYLQQRSRAAAAAQPSSSSVAGPSTTPAFIIKEPRNLPHSSGTHRWANSSSSNYDGDGGGDAPVRAPVLRSDTRLSLVAPFRVHDLSFHDPTVSVCEWACFDVIVRKTQPPHTASGRSSVDGATAPLELNGQRRVWDDGLCLRLSLASVNSELRIRRAQFISRAAARAAEEAACFGAGDPFLLALLRRQLPVSRRLERQRRQRRARSSAANSSRHANNRNDDDGDAPLLSADADELSPPERRFIRPKGGAAAMPLSAATASEGTPLERLLTGDEAAVTVASDVARSQLYGGPCVSELSKELQDALLSHVMADLGIGCELREYVCQMQYFMEQEEYSGWLARWRHVADRMQRAGPRT